MGGRTRKKTPKKAVSKNSAFIEPIVESVRKLLDKHADEIKGVMAESEQNIISIGMSAKIDGSEAETSIKTSLKFVQSVTDSITTRIDDENQGKFTFVDTFVQSDGDDDDDDKEEKEAGEPGKAE